MKINTARLLLILTVTALACLPSLAPAASQLELTPEEQVWLAEHPEIVLGAPTDYPPMVIKRKDGTHVGVLVDLFGQIGQVLNADIRLHIEDSWADIQEKAQSREIDGLAFGGRDPSRAATYNPTDVILTTYFSVFGRFQGEYQIKSFSDLNSMRIGYKRAARPTRSLLERLPSATLKSYASHESLTQALVRKEIDVIVAWMSYDHWRKEKMQGTIDNIYIVEEYPIEMVSHIRKDWPDLIPILNKVLAAMQQDDFPRLINRWFGEWPQQSKPPGVHLTPEERAWLAQNPAVRVRTTDHAPYLYLKDGQPVGIAVDLLSTVSKRTGVEFSYINPSPPFSQDLTGLEQHTGPDLIASLMPTPEREKAVLFTKPYVSSPRFIFIRDDSPFISSIKDLPGKEVAVVKDYAVHRNLAEMYPDIDLLVFKNNREALESVSSGRAFAFIGDLIATPAMINEFGFANLKAACPSGLNDHNIAMGIRSDWPELKDIINKVFEIMPASEKASIISNWKTVKVEHGIRSDDIRKWGLAIFLSASGIIFLFVFWNKQLSRKVKERTTKLMETESRFRSTFEQAAVGVAHVSLEGKFLRVNRKFCKITGYSESEMLDLTFQDITHPDDLDADLKQVQQLTSGAMASYSMDKRYVRKDRTEVWVNLTVSMVFDRGGGPKYFVSVVKDISDRKQAEEALQQSYAFLKHLTASVPDAIFSVRMPERVIEWASDSGNILGYKNKDYVGESTEKFYADPEEYQAVGALLSDAIQKGKDTLLAEVTLRRKNGEVFPAEINVAAYRENGEVAGATVLARDISDRLEAEKALRDSDRERAALREELIQAARRMAMGELTTAIAHELNQPLAAIMTNAQAARRFLKAGTSSQGEVGEILEDIIKDDRRAGDIIGKLRSLLKGEKLDFVEINVNEVLQEVVALVRSDMLIKKISLETQFTEETSAVLGDRTQLQQVILNLVLNASEALPAVEMDSRRIIIATQCIDGKGIRIGVSDTGPGLDDAMLDRLFDPFFTTKKEGMGIGLAISKTIVELHGGHIRAENNKEAGATFHVLLPHATARETP